MADYSRQIALAKRLVRAKGRQVTLQRLAGAASGSPTPWRGQTAPDDVQESASLFVVAVPPSSASSLGMSSVPDDMLKTLEQILIAEPGETAPEELDKFHRVVDFDDSVWSIRMVERLCPAEQTILYFIGIAR